MQNTSYAPKRVFLDDHVVNYLEGAGHPYRAILKWWASARAMRVFDSCV